MAWARTLSRAATLLGAALATATTLLIAVLITQAALGGNWIAIVNFNAIGEGPYELLAVWALLPTLAWLIHNALQHAFTPQPTPRPQNPQEGPPTTPTNTTQDHVPHHRQPPDSTPHPTAFHMQPVTTADPATLDPGQQYSFTEHRPGTASSTHR